MMVVNTEISPHEYTTLPLPAIAAPTQQEVVMHEGLSDVATVTGFNLGEFFPLLSTKTLIICSKPFQALLSQ
jgi:hypothetical protein